MKKLLLVFEVETFNQRVGSRFANVSTSCHRMRLCGVSVSGDGWSARAEDAVLHGCIPVVIMDNVDPIFTNILDWESFSIRIPEVICPIFKLRGPIAGHATLSVSWKYLFVL